MTRLGLALVVLPLAWWLYDVHHDPCGLQGDAWQQCRAHHTPHTPHHEQTTNGQPDATGGIDDHP